MIIEPKILLRDGHKNHSGKQRWRTNRLTLNSMPPRNWSKGEKKNKKTFQTVLVCHIFINTFGYIYIPQGPPQPRPPLYGEYS